MQQEHDTEQLLKEIDRDQSPVTWPQTLNSGRAVDQFLWKGDPKATPIQRVGLVIFALMFLLVFVSFVVVIIVIHDWVVILFGMMMTTLSGIAAFRFLSNAFRHQKHHEVDR